jgi:hypothetical protein
VAIFGIIMILPDEINVPNSVFWVPQIIVMYLLAKSFQGPVVETHQRLGGPMASAWGAAAIGILFAVIVFGAIIGIVMLLPE